MEDISNEEKAKEICHCSECTYKIKSEGDNCMCPRMASILQAMQWKDEQFAKEKQQWIAWLEKQGAEIVTEIVNDWTYGKDADHTVIPAIHQRIEGFMVGDKVKIQITKL